MTCWRTDVYFSSFFVDLVTFWCMLDLPLWKTLKLWSVFLQCFSFTSFNLSQMFPGRPDTSSLVCRRATQKLARLTRSEFSRHSSSGQLTSVTSLIHLLHTCTLSAWMSDMYIHVIQDFYFPDTLISFCEEVAAEAPNTPFYFYHIPVRTNMQGE